MTKKRTTKCPTCGKEVSLVMKQDPDMPKGVKTSFVAAHKCKDGQRYKA